MLEYETIKLTITDHIAQVAFNRPEKANALNEQAWVELKAVFEYLDENDDVRVVVLSGEGKHFCSGIDLSLLMSITNTEETCNARLREKLRKQILHLQSCITSIEACCKPVIASISGGCIGAGVDIISACDMRYASDDAFFTIKEIDMGMVADLGTLQRLPLLIPEGIMRELAFTGRKVLGKEAEKIGLVNQCFSSREELTNAVSDVAFSIASKSPVSIRGTKHILNYSRDHTVADGLNYMATWNAAMILSEDLTEAFQSQIQQRKAVFRN